MNVNVREMWGERWHAFELYLHDPGWEENPNVRLMRSALELIERHNPAGVFLTGITMCGNDEFQMIVVMDGGSRPLAAPL